MICFFLKPLISSLKWKLNAFSLRLKPKKLDHYLRCSYLNVYVTSNFKKANHFLPKHFSTWFLWTVCHEICEEYACKIILVMFNKNIIRQPNVLKCNLFCATFAYTQSQIVSRSIRALHRISEKVGYKPVSRIL